MHSHRLILRILPIKDRLRVFRKYVDWICSQGLSLLTYSNATFEEINAINQFCQRLVIVHLLLWSCRPQWIDFLRGKATDERKESIRYCQSSVRRFKRIYINIVRDLFTKFMFVCVCLFENRYYIDWCVVFCLAFRKQRLGNVKMMIKHAISIIPGVGTAIRGTFWNRWHLKIKRSNKACIVGVGWLALARSFTQDVPLMEKAFKEFLEADQPFWLLSHPVLIAVLMKSSWLHWN